MRTTRATTAPRCSQAGRQLAGRRVASRRAESGAAAAAAGRAQRRGCERAYGSGTAALRPALVEAAATEVEGET